MYNPYEDQWYRGDWYEAGTPTVDLINLMDSSGLDLHILVKAKILYTCSTIEFQDPPYRIILLTEYVSEHLMSDSDHWSTSPGGTWMGDLQPGVGLSWESYETTWLSIELVSISFEILSLKQTLLVIVIPEFRFELKKASISWYVKNYGDYAVSLWDKHAEAFIKIVPE